MKRIYVFLIFSLILGAFAGTTLAKPIPPANLEKIFSSFSELEEEYEKGQWDNGQKSLAKIDEAFRKLVPELNKSADNQYVQDYFRITGELKKSLEEKSDEGASKAFIRLQLLFLNLMNSYEYKVHPVVKIMADYVEEGKTAVLAGNWKDALGEAREILAFTRIGARALLDLGASKADSENLIAMAKKLVDLAQAKDKTTYLKLADELETLLGRYGK